MELRHLRYFTAVAECLSFRRAADRLHLTRPALSKQIKELEDELGVRLLNRTTAKVSLTSAGAVYLHEIRDVLARAERAAELARESATGKSGYLLIGDPGMLARSLLTPVLVNFRERFPNVEVTLRELPVNEHIAALQAGDIHVGFNFTERLPERVGLEGVPVLQLRVGLAVAPTHDLAQRHTVDLRELVAHPLLCIGDGRTSEHAHFVRERFASIGCPNPRIRLVSGINSLMTMVAGGLGLSLVPDSLAPHTAGEVVIVPLEGDPKSFLFEMQAIWRRQDDSLLVRNFVRALRRHARPGKPRP